MRMPTRSSMVRAGMHVRDRQGSVLHPRPVAANEDSVEAEEKLAAIATAKVRGTASPTSFDRTADNPVRRHTAVDWCLNDGRFRATMTALR